MSHFFTVVALRRGRGDVAVVGDCHIVRKKETVSVVAAPKRKTKQKEETHVEEEVEKQVRKHAHTATISLPLSKKRTKEMEEDDDDKSSLKPTRLEASHPNSTFDATYEPRPIEKKKKKNLKKPTSHGGLPLDKDPKAPTFSSIDWSAPPNTSSHSVHLTIIGDHDPETNKDNKYEDLSKDDYQITNSIPVTSSVPLRDEDRDSDNSDDVDDSTGGPIASGGEKSNSLSEDYEDTPSEDDKDFEDARPESENEASKVVDATWAESQLGMTKSFGVATITYKPIKDL
ncbi:uncharacterized protein LOC127095495 [Lathyrus oleraceus]|uniref:uncharacterized protein LOC127095495 n=1 Tax=Pisum sativum TaxID=3888 RepID=UPI0021D3A184|nr:uncharacterized protein LOC127095495 [Pisum sativum]